MLQVTRPPSELQIALRQIGSAHCTFGTSNPDCNSQRRAHLSLPLLGVLKIHLELLHFHTRV
jgi:hypothetical protein